MVREKTLGCEVNKIEAKKKTRKSEQEKKKEKFSCFSPPTPRKNGVATGGGCACTSGLNCEIFRVLKRARVDRIGV